MRLSVTLLLATSSASAASASAASASAANPSVESLEAQFEAWKLAHRRDYATVEEDAARFSVWTRSYSVEKFVLTKRMKLIMSLSRCSCRATQTFFVRKIGKRPPT